MRTFTKIVSTALLCSIACLASATQPTTPVAAPMPTPAEFDASLNKAVDASNDIVAEAVTSSQILLSAQQIRLALIWSRNDGRLPSTIADLVKGKYLSGAPAPYEPATRVDGSLLELKTSKKLLCSAMERKAKRSGAKFYASPRPGMFGCYARPAGYVVYYRL